MCSAVIIVECDCDRRLRLEVMLTCADQIPFP